MKHVETCSCGGSIELHYEGETRYSYANERQDAKDALDKFRRRHKDCGKVAPPAKEAPS